MLDTLTSRLIYKERSYIKTLRTAIALLAKYGKQQCRTFGPILLLLYLASTLPWALGALPANQWQWQSWPHGLILVSTINGAIFIPLLFRAQYYVYITYYIKHNAWPSTLAPWISGVLYDRLANLILVNYFFRLPYLIALFFVWQWLSGFQHLGLLVGASFVLVVVSAYLHVVAVVLEFYYVFEQRTLLSALALAFKQGLMHWGNLFLVSFVAELAAIALTLACAAPFVVAFLSLDNAYTLSLISNEPQQLPWAGYALLAITGTIAFVGTLFASVLPLWANTLQCGTIARKESNIHTAHRQ